MPTIIQLPMDSHWAQQIRVNIHNGHGKYTYELTLKSSHNTGLLFDPIDTYPKFDIDFEQNGL